MDYVTGIQKAIDYVERNLTGEIDYEQAAKCACMSVFHFQRVFGLLCGMTLGDYIRARRLTISGGELISGNAKIIDIALKYGYDSPESFTRAFSKFHGITPSEARRGGRIKSFSRISVKLILIGGNTMDYRIEKCGKMKILCKRKRVRKPVNDSAVADISKFWADSQADGSIDKLCKMYPDDSPVKGLLGVCFTADIENMEFPYGIGFALGETPVDSTGFDVVELPDYTYAVFTVKGKMPEAFTETYRRICTEFFPQSDYEYAGGAELEVYPSPDIENPDYTCEIWIAVK